MKIDDTQLNWRLCWNRDETINPIISKRSTKAVKKVKNWKSEEESRPSTQQYC